MLKNKKCLSKVFFLEQHETTLHVHTNLEVVNALKYLYFTNI